MIIPATPSPLEPFLFDKAIAEIQLFLKNNLSWLDYAFGRTQELIKFVDKQIVKYPAVYISNGVYNSVLPDQKLGNFSFFEVYEPQSVAFKANQYNDIKAKYALVFWFDQKKIFPGAQDRTVEALKAQILRVMTREMHLTNGRITINQIYEQADSLYRGYSLKEIDIQHVMFPFGGLRFEGDMTIFEGRC